MRSRSSASRGSVAVVRWCLRFFSFVSDVVGAVDVDAEALDAAEASDWLAADGGERREMGIVWEGTH